MLSAQPERRDDDAAVRRLVITDVSLTNFKSYAGTQQIGPFHKSFTSIVGPNGSGKSNVIDAMLFVFGYRASKIRQNKLSQLIHHSEKHPQLDYCSVTVHFEEILDRHGVDAYEPVPNTKLTVSRLAFRNNSSKYEINGKTSSHTEVTTLLRDRGIDLDHKRFLILQGEVESIAQMKPKASNEHEEGLLEYLEDIIGTAKYKLTIEAAGIEVETLSEQRGEKLNRVKIVESQRAALEGKRQEALSYLRSENELTVKKSMLWQYQLHDCAQNIENNKQTITSLKNQIEQERQQHLVLTEDVDRLEKEHVDLNADHETYMQKITKLESELSVVNNHDVKLREHKKSLKSKVDKLKKAADKDKLTMSEQTSWISNYQHDVTKRETELKELGEKLAREEKELDKIRASLTGKTAGIQSEIEAKQIELAPWTEQIAAKTSELDIAKAEYDTLVENTSRKTNELDETKAKLNNLRILLDTKQTAGPELDRLNADVTIKIKKLTTELQAGGQEDGKLRETLNQSRAKADEARALLQSAQSRGNVLGALLSERDKGRIPGIYNRLGNLGVIDDKYDVAISTACPQLDNIVVDAVRTGEKCLEFLRRQNVGRAHIVCLDKLQIFDLSSITTPENVPRLFDLVKPKEKQFALAFYYALRDTLVANDLDQANRIAFGRKRWRVVTLAGQLIDTSGTMSGGGGKISRGLMSSKFIKDDVQEEDVVALERQRDDTTRRLTVLSDSQRKLQSDLESLQAALSTIPMERSKLAMEVDSLKKQITDTERRIQRLNEGSKVDEKDIQRLKTLSQTMHRFQTELEQLRQSSGIVEAQIKTLQDTILKIGGVQLRTQNSIVDSIIEQIDTLNNDIIRIAVQKTKAERDLTKSTKNYKKSVTELEVISAELKTIEAEIAEHTEHAVELTNIVNEEKIVLEEKKGVLDGLRADLDLKTQKLNTARKIELDLLANVEEAERHLRAMVHKARELSEDLVELSLQPIAPEDDIKPERDDDGGENNDDDDDEENEIKQENHEKHHLKTYTNDELLQFNIKSLTQSVAELEEKMKRVKPNLTVIAEYRQRYEEYLARAEELREVTEARDEARARYDDLRKCRLDRFLEGFNSISQKLKEMYQMITLGGNAELELADSMDPFSEGGEKTLSSLALVFALHHFKPTPLYVMDEIDAALDFRNVSIIANYIKDRTRDAQFVIISLRNNMFELADRLVGIYKTDNCTKSITINPKAISMVASKS